MHLFRLVDFNYSVGLDVLKSFDIVNYLIVVIVLLAVVLAIFNEDASTGSPRLSWVLGEFLPIQQSIFSLNANAEKKLFKKKNSKTYAFITFICNLFIKLKCAITEGTFLHLLIGFYKNGINKLVLYKNLAILKSKSESKRHFYYLILKDKYKLPIEKGENEMKSYLDAKRELVRMNKWAFMWKVSGVKNEYITCENAKVRPISSYSYLDFIREPLVQNSAIKAAMEWSTGNHGPRLLGGNNEILRDLEKKVGQFFGRNDSILAVCGFLACMSGIAAVATPSDLVLYDSRTHACVKIGIQISGAKAYTFKHNNYNNLEILLLKHRSKYRTCWVCIESVYSMDGDIPHLPSFKKLCNKYNAKLFVDEAHGLGVLGKTGRGLEEHFNMPGSVDLIVGTFSKSIGSVGGYIVASDEVIEFMDIHCIGNVFSAPLPSYCAGGALKAFELIDTQPWRIEKLKFNTKYLRNGLRTGMGLWPKDYPDSNKYVIEGDDETSVIPVIFPNDPDRLLKICNVLFQKKWMISAVTYPACPLKLPRFRVTATSAYSVEYMNDFIRDLISATISVEPSPFDRGLL
ncbi:serine C-palmitoyltransferase, putative [Plasmodium knowlesi strain H]|uniref:serine C-palmitoyltransferase n=3 Tax=Plasmodium knowlesi TaxID=5850 RepID=A0A5K1VCN7_PLAKH|nr:serine palmitoyltransferase, putative [Plasmodium knowlesi strain H]OTN67665.1 putative Glycine C-acetyltransferase [Plasmodium knowlesi]CAA9990449.1 serine palmitoyltransferase, putative [Plasmodium knowlesi strain H]SBO19655.1 serine C-palmitoyltransferase, putative [Plasmodium knowlesi strain H]SBO22524.1 serine C-palmitoyltransferase, putative [Plasmodium knowlesi strain H]VVS79923.1 serine palmitoyltransferase, putative [Plasmodium knowlesi strain H]|eukprot:XP_002260835.1 glycine C-acetyltransferase, putative [Plasmodium knowlesi strain H]